MSKQPEYIVVARDPEDPSKRGEVIERFFQNPNDLDCEYFARALERQTWLRFQENYRSAFIYECYPMSYSNRRFYSSLTGVAPPQGGKPESSEVRVEKVMRETHANESEPEPKAPADPDALRQKIARLKEMGW